MAFKLALAQMLVEGGQPQENLYRAEARIQEAAQNGAQLVLLPEALDLGWTHPMGREKAAPIPMGNPCKRLSEKAKENQVYVCAGLTEREGEAVFNAAVLIDPQGKVLLKHRKLNELAMGHQVYDQGDRLGVVHTPLGTLGLMICADGYVNDQVITRTLGYMGAQVVLAPSAWAVPPDFNPTLMPYGNEWRESLSPVAKNFSLYIAAVSNVGTLTWGPWAGHPCIGNSLVFGPTGKEILTGSYGEKADEILYTEVAPLNRPARGCTWNDHWGQEGYEGRRDKN